MNDNECCVTEAPRLQNDASQLVQNCRDAIIKKVTNGFIVNIGCQTFVSKDWQEISDGLTEYWKDPIAAEKKFCAK